MTVTAKMVCQSIDVPKDAPTEYRNVHLRAVYSNDPSSENYSWSNYTPYANLVMYITNPDAFNQFENGKEYLISISEV